MKKKNKFISIVTALSAAFILSACAENKTVSSGSETAQPIQNGTKETAEGMPESESPGNTLHAEETAGGTLVVYFSATGTTKGAAEKIAAITAADIYEIIPAEPYSGEDLNYNDEKSRASNEMKDPDARPEIGGKTISFEGYSTIYLGYPIWWGDAPRIMSTFAESYDFEGITVIPFCTSGGSGIGESGRHLAEQAGSGNWLTGQRFSGNVSEEELRSWIDGL